MKAFTPLILTVALLLVGSTAHAQFATGAATSNSSTTTTTTNTQTVTPPLVTPQVAAPAFVPLAVAPVCPTFVAPNFAPAIGYGGVGYHSGIGFNGVGYRRGFGNFNSFGTPFYGTANFGRRSAFVNVGTPFVGGGVAVNVNRGGFFGRRQSVQVAAPGVAVNVAGRRGLFGRR